MRFFTILFALMLSGLLLQAQAGNPCPGEPAVTYEGQVYNTVLVGDKCWLKENLNVGVMILSDVDQANNGILEKYCYDDLPANCEAFGGLYQWGELMQYDLTPGSRGICPVGWRIPTDDEWKMLEGALDSQFGFDDPQWDNFNFRGFDAGKNIKSSLGWMYDGNGEDELGISVLPGGHRDFCGTYYTEGFANYQWTSTVYDDKTAWYRIITSNSDLIGRRYAHKDMGASVRCIKDITLTYTLALEVSPAEAGTVEGGGEYEEGEEINITATANQGWEFSNWTDSDDNVVSEEATFIYVMPATDITLIANFVEEPVIFVCGTPLVDQRDGQSYATLQFDDQCWMVENLNIGTRINGNKSQANNGIIEKYCSGDDPSNCDIYGGLYIWNEAMGYSNDEGSQGICPDGWHIPTDAEWAALVAYAKTHPEWVCGSNISNIGKALASKDYWNSSTVACAVGNNPSANNASGFGVLPAGRRHYDGTYQHLKAYGFIWTSTLESGNQNNAWCRHWISSNAMVTRYNWYKAYANSVRCIADEFLPTPTSYTLNLVADPPAAGVLEGDGDYFVGEEVSVTATANQGWEFVNWTINDEVVSEEPSFNYIMPGHGVTLTAHFIVQEIPFNCGELLFDIRDGQSYSTIQIGDQCWMAENLNIGTQINGTVNQTNNGIIEKYCYNNNPDMCDTFGGLYLWNEMRNYVSTEITQGICPYGWHVPYDEEWTDLLEYLKTKPEYKCGEEAHALAQGLASKEYWESASGGCDPGYIPENNNSTGFGALPGGRRHSNGSFDNFGKYSFMWTATNNKNASNNAFSRNIVFNNRYLLNESYYNQYGFGVRCIRDYDPKLSLEVFPIKGGTAIGAGAYEVGEDVNLIAQPSSGWQFAYWTDVNDNIVSEEANYTFIMPEKNTVLTANFYGDLCGGTHFVDARDGNTYKMVQIGDQCWMAEHLKYLESVYPSYIGTTSYKDPYQYVVGYEGFDVEEAKATENYSTFGVLYNWPATMDGASSSNSVPSGVQGICPDGWHVPSNNEIINLFDYVKNQPEYFCSGYAGWTAKALAAKTNWWEIVWGKPCVPGMNPEKNNATGFTFIPGGDRHESGGFEYLTFRGSFWSTTQYDTVPAAWFFCMQTDWEYPIHYYYGIDSDSSGVRYADYMSKGFSVRCLKDYVAYYTLTLRSVPLNAGVVSGAGVHAVGEEITVTATANEGWEFEKWTDANGVLITEEPSFIFTMPSSNTTLRAIFIEQ